jgi:hypothetical protein
VLRPLDRVGQLADHRVHARLELADRLGYLILAAALQDPEHEQREQQRRERRTDGGEGDRHRHSFTISLLSWSRPSSAIRAAGAVSSPL